MQIILILLAGAGVLLPVLWFLLRFLRKEKPLSIFSFGEWLALCLKGRREDARLMLLLYGIFLLACFLGIFGFSFSGRRELQGSIPRESGKNLKLEILDEETGEKEETTLTLLPALPEEEEIYRLFDREALRLKKEIPGKNPDLLHIREDLSLPETGEDGIRFAWESGNPLYLSDRGEVFRGNVPKEGARVLLKLQMNLALVYEKRYTFELFLEGGTAEKSLSLSSYLEEENERRSGRKLLLPEEPDGRRLRYFVKEESALLPLSFLLFLALPVLFLGRRMEREKGEKKRREELQAAYEGFTMELSLLLQSGISTIEAMRRLATGRKDRLGGLLRNTVSRVQNGVPEEEAYTALSSEIGLYSYRKLLGLLVQYLRQGGGGFEELMEEEMLEAASLEKQRVRRKAEEASAKMLLPMLILFSIVLMSMIAPLFLGGAGGM